MDSVLKLKEFILENQRFKELTLVPRKLSNIDHWNHRESLWSTSDNIRPHIHDVFVQYVILLIPYTNYLSMSHILICWRENWRLSVFRQAENDSYNQVKMTEKFCNQRRLRSDCTEYSLIWVNAVCFRKLTWPSYDAVRKRCSSCFSAFNTDPSIFDRVSDFDEIWLFFSELVNLGINFVCAFWDNVSLAATAKISMPSDELVSITFWFPTSAENTEINSLEGFGSFVRLWFESF